MKLASITFALASLISSAALAQQQPWPQPEPAPADPSADASADQGQAPPSVPAPPMPVNDDDDDRRLPRATAVAYVAPPAAPAPTISEQSPDEVQQVDERVLHGFRVGYGFIFNYDKDPDGDGELKSLQEEFEIQTPHNFLLGYEVMYRLIGHDWLNVVLVGNVTIAGLEQSKFIPQGSGLIGAEFNESFQLGVGVNVTPEPDRPAHMIMAAGWTPEAGGFHVPFHVFFIPDVDGFHRTGVTTGVTW